MSVTLLATLMAMFLISPAQAQDGTLIWIQGTPDPSFHPELRVLPLDKVAPSLNFAPKDAAALDRLRKELEAVRPLVDEFDGELQIMSRLSAVIGDLPTVRNEDERALLYAALVFQGFAVHRYFQDTLATDPAAEPYRMTLGGEVVPKAWVAAVAVDPDRDPSPFDLPDPGSARAFDEVRAATRLAPRASVIADGLPEGAALVVDGRPPDSAGRVYVPPGPHWAIIVSGDTILARSRQTLESGQELHLTVGARAEDFSALAESLAARPEAWSMDPRLVEVLSPLPPPVYLALETSRGPTLYEVKGNAAVLAQDDAAGPDKGMSLALRAGVGGGWLYDGEFFLQHSDEAPYTRSTVNVPVGVVSAGLGLRKGLLGAGLGLDLAAPMGDYSTVVSGDQTLRLRAHPYASVGLPWVQASAGYLFPWHATVGLRVAVPLRPWLELGGAGVYGLGIDQAREGDLPTFEPAAARMAWLGVQGHFGLVGGR